LYAGIQMLIRGPELICLARQRQSVLIVTISHEM
jgi:hypothetical protein